MKCEWFGWKKKKACVYKWAPGSDDGMLAVQLRSWKRFFFAQGCSCKIPQFWFIPRWAAALKYDHRFSLQQHCDLTLYYTGLYTPTSRMRRCPPLHAWFSATRASFSPETIQQSRWGMWTRQVPGKDAQLAQKLSWGWGCNTAGGWGSETHLSEESSPSPRALPRFQLCPHCWCWLAGGRSTSFQVGLK